MVSNNDLNVTPGSLPQTSSLTGMTSNSPLESSASVFTGERDPEDMNEDAIDTLNNLIECCRDGDYGFRECAEHTKSHDIKAVLNQRAGDCKSAAAELHELIVQLGGKPDNGGSFGVDINRNYGYQWAYDGIGSSEIAQRGADDRRIGQSRGRHSGADHLKKLLG